MSGIIKVGQELDKLKFYEDALDYHFKPNKEKTHPSFKRHILFKEIKEDFEREVSSYGFCPFIHKPFEEQIKDKNLMKFKKNPFVNFFLLYAKQSNKSLEETNREKLILESLRKKKKTKQKKGRAYSAVSSQQSESEIAGEEEQQLDNKDRLNVFLSKALNSIKNKNSLFGDLLIDKTLQLSKKKKLGKSSSAPNLNELADKMSLDQSLLKSKNPFDIYKNIEKTVNDPKYKDKIISMIPNWTTGFNKNKGKAIQTFGKKLEVNKKTNENVMLSMLKTRYNLMKEKELNQKRKINLEMQKEKELEIQKKLLSKAKIAKEERIKLENEIMKDKNNIFNLAEIQCKRNDFLQKFVDEEDEQLSDNDPLIVYGLIKKKNKQE